MTLQVDGSSPAGVRGATSTVSTASFSPPGAALLVAFVDADANNGSTTEQCTVTSTGGLSWTLKTRANGSPGATAEVWYAITTGAPGSITVSVTDNQGAVDKSLYVRALTDTNGGAPSIGATAASATTTTSYTSTVNNSWGWCTGIGAAGTPVAGSGQTIQDSAASFDGGDATWTVSQNAVTAVTATTVNNGTTNTTVVHQIAVEILPGVVATATYPPQLPRARRAVPLRVTRTRQAVPVRAQVNPPYPTVEIVQPRRLRGALARRGHTVTPVPPQVNPPYPFAEVVQPRRLRGLLARRGRAVTPVPAQIVVTPPAYPPPELVQPRRLRGLLARRGHLFAPPWPQQTPPSNPAFVPGPARHVRIFLPWLRGTQNAATVVPAADAPPGSGHRARPVVALVRRTRTTATPPAQGWLPTLRARLRAALPKRRGRIAPVPLVGAPPPPPPAYVPTVGRYRLRWAWWRRGSAHGAPAPVVCDCTTHRPTTGVVGRPDTGTVARPDTGIVRDPCC